MYRNNQEALQNRADALSREAELLRRENEAIRASMRAPKVAFLPSSLPPDAIYKMDVRTLPLSERARLAEHSVTAFPVWAVAILNIITLGLFPMIHFGLLHNRLPKAAHNDPLAGKAIGFQFIPYYNLYWIFFSSLRLCDRINLQFKLRGLSSRAPRGLMLAACILSVIPYGFILSIPILWTISVIFLQIAVNKVATLNVEEWDATPSAYDVQGGPAAPFVYDLSAEEKIKDTKARTLVMWSHILGWGGFAFLILGCLGSLIVANGAALVIIASLAAISIVVGAVVGQVGRGMQGRAI